MAANIEIFGKDIQEWLGDTEPYEDDELDSVLIAASDEYECSQSPPPASASAPAQTSSSHTRFAPPTTEVEIQRARKERIPQKTRQDTKFCTKVWEAWREERKNNKTEYTITRGNEQHRYQQLAESLRT